MLISREECRLIPSQSRNARDERWKPQPIEVAKTATRLEKLILVSFPKIP